MDNVLFLLIDDIESFLKTRYLKELKVIHENLLKKLYPFGGEILVAGSESDFCAQKHFNNIKDLFSYAATQAKGRDIIVANAYSGALCVDQTKEILNFLRTRQYDISFAEHMPEGLIPSVIAGEFAEDFLYFLDEKTSFDTPFKELVNWEYKGIDVGVYLSSSRIAMERIDFLPVEKNSILYLNELSYDLNFTLEKAENLLEKIEHKSINFPTMLQLNCAQKQMNSIQPIFPKNLISLSRFSQTLYKSWIYGHRKLFYL